MYLSGILVKLHDVQFLPIACAMLEPFTEYSWYLDSDGVLQPRSTHILKPKTANKTWAIHLEWRIKRLVLTETEENKQDILEGTLFFRWFGPRHCESRNVNWKVVWLWVGIPRIENSMTLEDGINETTSGFEVLHEPAPGKGVPLWRLPRRYCNTSTLIEYTVRKGVAANGRPPHSSAASGRGNLWGQSKHSSPSAWTPSKAGIWIVIYCSPLSYQDV